MQRSRRFEILYFIKTTVEIRPRKIGLSLPKQFQGFGHPDLLAIMDPKAPKEALVVRYRTVQILVIGQDQCS